MRFLPTLAVFIGLLEAYSTLAFPIREGFRNCSGETLSHSSLWELPEENEDPSSERLEPCTGFLMQSKICIQDFQKTPFQRLSLSALSYQLTRLEMSLMKVLPEHDPIFYRLSKVRDEWELLMEFLMEEDPLGEFERFDEHGIYTYELLINLPGLYCHAESLTPRDYTHSEIRRLANLDAFSETLLRIEEALDEAVVFWTRFKTEN